MSTVGTRAPRRSPAHRRSQIRTAARALALDEGLSAVTLRAVAARAQVTPALVAHYVPGMDDLVADTFSAIVGDELDDLVTASAAGSPTARLAVLLRALLDGTRDDVTLVWVEAYARGRRSEQLATAVRVQMDRWQRVLHELIADGVRAGEFHVDHPADAAWQLLGMIDGLNAQALVRWGAAAERSTLLERSVEGLLALAPGALERTPATTPHTGGTP